MRIKNWSELYAFGYFVVTIGRNTFYKRDKVVGLENIPKDKPVIFAANHQNAFMDPILISVSLTTPTAYLVRADIFKKKLIAKIFAAINMLPIYRERDGVNTKVANQGTFNECYDILSKNRPIIIFPEGNHGKYKNLRSIKKGFARIGKGAEVKYGDDIDVQVVPVGLNYSDHVNMGAEFLLIYGQPIDLSHYVSALDDARGLNNITKVLSQEMSKVMIDIQDLDNYQYINEMLIIFDQEIRDQYVQGSDDLMDKFKAQKQFIASAENWLASNETQEPSEYEEKMINFRSAIQKQGLRYWLFKKEKHNTLLSIIGLLLFFPIHLYGMINNYIPYKIPVNFVKKIKDQQFHSSLKMALGVFAFLILWPIQIALVGLFTDDGIWMYYAASLPVSAWISYQYWIRLLKTKGQIKYNKLNTSRNKDFISLKARYDDLVSDFKNIVG